MRDEIDLILATSWKPNKEEFLTALGIYPGGFGEQLFRTVFETLFVDSIEVKGEYNKYYFVEYANFSEYLIVRYGQTLTEEELEASSVFIVSGLPQIIDENYEDNKLGAVLECIQKLEEANNES
ncbi:hypothetical protein [Photobacterium kishitanii]|uniref:Uncharacterized protein n=1 Tax=Photobacterium kishitanii TaxID=318456 RepID=A0A2T3KEF2_9GAMM|nr:hypothetical protein [Photobacterium kishitanii]PSU95697.1 hypothetical protein C9J27_17640 [Photobacterium kishitanii]